MKRTVTARFDSLSGAEEAATRLRASGLARGVSLQRTERTDNLREDGMEGAVLVGNPMATGQYSLYNGLPTMGSGFVLNREQMANLGDGATQVQGAFRLEAAVSDEKADEVREFLRDCGGETD